MSERKTPSWVFWISLVAITLIFLAIVAFGMFIWFWLRPSMRAAGTWPLP